jgi:hypothetical protein
MPSVNISITVTDAAGASSTQSTTVVADGAMSVVTIDSMVVTPQSAPSGTARTLDVAARSSSGAALTFETPVATGITFTAVTGQPAGHARWNFSY